MNTIGIPSPPPARAPENGESQPTDRENQFSDLLSECLKQQHDGALDILLQGALQDSNPRMIGIVGRHLIQASVGQRQAIVNWTRMLSHEQLDEFNAQWHPIKTQLQTKQTAREHKLHELLKNTLQSANASYLPRVLAWIGKSQSARLVDVVAGQFFHANEPQRQVMVDWVVTLPTDLALRFVDRLPTLRETLSQRHPHIAVHLAQASGQAELCAAVGRQYHRATGSSIGEIDRWSETLNAPEREAFLGGKRARLLAYVADNNSSLFRYLDAQSMARLGLVSRDIRRTAMARPRFEAAGLMKDFPAFHALPENECHARSLEFLRRVEQSECPETKVEALTQLAKHLFFMPAIHRGQVRATLLSCVNALQPAYLRAQPLAALMASQQSEPVFIRRAFKAHPMFPDWRLLEPVNMGPWREHTIEPLDPDQFRALWQSAMNLDQEWQKPLMTALLRMPWGRDGRVGDVLKDVLESDNEHWKSTLLPALSDCFPSINLHSEEQVEVLLSLMKKTKGTGPEFLALALLPDFIAKKIYHSAKGFKILLNFISTWTPGDLQKPALLALAETLEHTWASDQELYDNCAAMLEVCRKTEDQQLEYALRLALNKGIRRLNEVFSQGSGFLSAVSRMVKEAEESAQKFKGLSRLALDTALGSLDIAGDVPLDRSRCVEPRTLIALAGGDHSAQAVRSHLQQFPESNHPELLVVLIKQQWTLLHRQFAATDLSQDIEFFIQAIGQLPAEQQTRPLRALLHLCSFSDAQGVSKHLLALGELCRQSPMKAELITGLADQCIGKVWPHGREAIAMPLDLFEAIYSDMSRMSDVDRCAVYFALQDVAERYPEQIAPVQLAKLEPVFEHLKQQTPPRHRR